MKQFLKSTAIFACMAFLFCACSDDGTDDAVVSTSSNVSSFRLLQAGEERAWVKWTVPSVDNIASCQISWSGSTSSGSVSGSVTVDQAVEGIMEAKIGETFTNIVYGDYTRLPAGDYTFTVKSLSSSGSVLGEDSADLYIYDQDTYENKTPARPEISEIVVDGDGAWITWGNIPQDCIGVNITFMDSYWGVKNDTELISIVEGVPINIATATPNTTFTFETHFQPNEGQTNVGLDVIILANDDDEDYMFPSLMPTSARSVSARPGDGRFIVYWNVPLIADITSSYIEYTNESGEIARVEVKGDDLKKGLASENQNSSEFKGLAAGEYTVTIYNVNNPGEVSEPESTTVTVYNEDTYPVGAKIKQDITLNSDYEAEIAWDYSGVSTEALADCWGVIAHVGEKYSITSTDDLKFSETNTWSYIASMVGDEEVSYTTYFRPEDGLDFIALPVSDDEKNTVPATLSPDKPTNVVFSPGNYSLFLEFDLTTDASISKIVIEYDKVLDPEDETDEPESGQITFEKGNFILGRDNFVGVGLEDGLKLNREYDLKIWTENSSNVKSGYESADALLVYDFEDFQSDCVMPTFTYEFGIDYPYGIEMVWTDTGCDYVDFTYVYNTDGLTTTITIEDFSNPIVLPDVMPGNYYSWQATFNPAPNAMNTYVMSRTSSTPFPYLGVDKSLITQYSDNMLGEATEVAGDVSFYGFSTIFDDLVSASTSVSVSLESSSPPVLKTSAIDNIGKYITTSGQAGKTLSYDLGATYKLAEFYYTPYLGYVAHAGGIESSTLYYNYTVIEFSLYGTNTEDPVNNASYNRVNTDGTAYLENSDDCDWVCLLDHAIVCDLNNELYSTDMDYDYNGDKVVDATDMSWAVLNGGFPFTIPEENRVPVRYLRLQFHKAANYDLVNGDSTYEAYRDVFMIVELNHTHMGCDVE